VLYLGTGQSTAQPMDGGIEELERDEEFGELVRFTAAGFLGGLVLGVALDSLGYQLSSWGQWLVRTLSGEGESVFEGTFALRQRFRRARGTMAEAYGWGKVIGMTVPWIVDWGSRAAGIDVYGVEGFYIPYLYTMSDQMGANVSGLLARYPGWVRTSPSAHGQPARRPPGSHGAASGAHRRIQPHDADLYRAGGHCGQPVLGSSARGQPGGTLWPRSSGLKRPEGTDRASTTVSTGGFHVSCRETREVRGCGSAAQPEVRT
jgi:hypothetical protein